MKCRGQGEVLTLSGYPGKWTLLRYLTSLQTTAPGSLEPRGRRVPGATNRRERRGEHISNVCKGRRDSVSLSHRFF